MSRQGLHEAPIATEANCSHSQVEHVHPVARPFRICSRVRFRFYSQMNTCGVSSTFSRFRKDVPETHEIFLSPAESQIKWGATQKGKTRNNETKTILLSYFDIE